MKKTYRLERLSTSQLPTNLSEFIPLSRRILESLDVRDDTRNQYQRDLTPFIKFLDIMKIETPYSNLMLDYKTYLRNRVDIKTTTKNRYLISVRIFFQQLYRLELLSKDYSVGVKGFKISSGLKKRGLKDSEIELVLDDLKNTKDLRLKSIIYLFYFQGLRIGELNKLQIKDFNSDDMTLQIYGKSQDDYEVINLHPSSVETLNEYLKSEKLKSGYMFVSRSNNSLNKPLTTRSIRRMVDSFHKSLGFVLNPHSYRKTFTTKLVKSLPNLMDVMKFTRHRSIQMIQTYYDSLEKKSLLPIYYNTFELQSEKCK